MRYNDIFAIHTKYVCVHGVCDKKMETVYLKSGRNARFEEIPRVHCREREGKIMIRKNDLRDLIYEEDGIGVVEIILILVVLIMLVVIFRKQITGIVSSAFSNINEDSETINEDIELDE